MKKINKINIKSFILLMVLSFPAFSILHIANSIVPYDKATEIILCGLLILVGIIYIMFSLYSFFFYKNGSIEILGGIVAIVVGVVDLRFNMMHLNIYNNSIIMIVMVIMLLFMAFKGIQAVVTLIDNNQKLKSNEEMLKASIIMTKGVQIKAHFIFNVLNAISAMCKYNPEKADEAIVRFSRIMRVNMDVIEEDKPILFNAVIEQLDNYIALEKIRFGEKFTFKKEIEFSNFKFPLLILQPIVENSIKHGVTPKFEGGEIILKTWKEDNTIYIEIKDDGMGFDLETLETKESIGLNNIRFRLKHMVNGDLLIDSEPKKGTKVTITVPYKEGK